jgi:hypothetical protein
MNTFRSAEQRRQAALKSDRKLFTDQAGADGFVSKKDGARAYSHVLPVGSERENLFAGYRQEMIDMFALLGISWHQGRGGSPNPNLCSSQVCAVNFLAPFVRNAELTALLLGKLFSDFAEALPFEDVNGPVYVTFEWIGQQNYLRERTGKSAKRNRGRNCTSADAAVRYRRRDGLVHTVLIEWKYTEHYSSAPLAIARKSGTDRRKIYRHLFDSKTSPILLSDYEGIFFDPFYQLFRQQALAECMEAAREDGADIVSVLHIAPSANGQLLRVTSPAFISLGSKAFEVWKHLLSTRERFRSVSTREVFGDLVSYPPKGLEEWADYVGARYEPMLSEAPP